MQAESREILRSQITLAAYNPRKISEKARKQLKANLKRVGLMGGIVWNESSGNLVSGHQKVGIMDEVNRYDPETHKNDYKIRVEVVHLTEKEEKEQNLFMNNRAVQGEFDDDLLIKMLGDIEYQNAGFDDFDMEMLGIADIPEEIEKNDFTDITTIKDGVIEAEQWRKESVVQDNAHLTSVDNETTESEENTQLDRSVDFYNDSEENQIARHNEVQKIKDRIKENAATDDDRVVNSYVVLSFGSPSETETFLLQYGYPVETKVIDGEEFLDRLEFGYSDSN